MIESEPTTAETPSWMKRNQTILSWPYLPKDVKDYMREKIMISEYGQDSFIPFERMGDIEDDGMLPDILRDFIDEYEIDPANTVIHLWW